MGSGWSVWVLAVSETHGLTIRSGYVQVPGLTKVRAHSFFQPKFTEHLLHTSAVPATEDAAVDKADRVKKERKRTEKS